VIEMRVRKNDRIDALEALESRQPEPPIASCIESRVDEKAPMPERVVVRIRTDFPRTTDCLKSDSDGTISLLRNDEFSW
jgi:hypothetical protein